MILVKDAFYSVLIFPRQRNVCVSFPKGKIYQFLAMPIGYIDAMRISNKWLKPAFALLHLFGYGSSVYVDDSFLLDETFEKFYENVLSTIPPSKEPRFFRHGEISRLTPSQITFLGLEIGIINMTLTLTFKKKEKLKDIASALLFEHLCSIINLASFLENVVLSFEAVLNQKLCYHDI